MQTEPLFLPVLALESGWLAVDKPCGISVHNQPGKDVCSRVGAYLAGDAAVQRRLAPEPGYGLHAVNRLDKLTSGVILLACRADTFAHFARQFETRLAHKRYVAILHGRLLPRDDDEGWGLWSWALAKEAGGRQSPLGRGPKVACQTRYQVLDYSRHYTLAALMPLTGRKHQLRRHAKLAGHPIVGDQRYGSQRSLAYLHQVCAFERLALHAQSLTIVPPHSVHAQTIETEALPEAMAELFADDRPATVG